MKFLKLTQSVTFEVAVPVDDDTPVGPIIGDEAEELQRGAAEIMAAQAKAMGGKVISVETNGEVVEV